MITLIVIGALTVLGYAAYEHDKNSVSSLASSSPVSTPMSTVVARPVSSGDMVAANAGASIEPSTGSSDIFDSAPAVSYVSQNERSTGAFVGRIPPSVF